jgi:hypothetical protein
VLLAILDHADSDKAITKLNENVQKEFEKHVIKAITVTG